MKIEAKIIGLPRQNDSQCFKLSYIAHCTIAVQLIRLTIGSFNKIIKNGFYFWWRGGGGDFLLLKQYVILHFRETQSVISVLVDGSSYDMQT